jgi:hypothetical protein
MKRKRNQLSHNAISNNIAAHPVEYASRRPSHSSIDIFADLKPPTHCEVASDSHSPFRNSMDFSIRVVLNLPSGTACLPFGTTQR